MADLATPSSAAIGTIDAGSESNAPDLTKQSATAKPEKPDDAAYQKALEDARKDLAESQERVKQCQARVNAGRPGKDSPVAIRQQELRAQLSEIRGKQQEFKSSRTGVQDRMKTLDAQIKNKIAEQKTARARIPHKSAEDIDREIQNLEQQVDGGKMKLVDEKKALAEVSSLRKQRKAFAGLDESQKDIEALKSKLNDEKKGLENPEYKALSDEYTKIAAELDTIKGEQDTAFKDLNSARDALTKAKEDQNAKYAAVKQIQDTYHQSRRAHQDWEREANRQRIARQKAERDAFYQAKRRKDAETRLEEASIPAYGHEMSACDNLARLLDPTYTKDAEASGPGKFAAIAQRTVDGGDFKGTKISKKDDDEAAYFVGGAGKKNKKGKKGQSSGTASPAPESSGRVDLGRLLLPDVIESFDLIGVKPPSSQEDVSNVLQQVKEKKKFYLQDQQRKTDENVAKAKKEIAQYEAGATNGTSTQGVGTDDTPSAAGAPPADKNHVTGVAESLETTSLADVSTEGKSADNGSAT